jgi:hypothetical protein
MMNYHHQQQQFDQPLRKSVARDQFQHPHPRLPSPINYNNNIHQFSERRPVRQTSSLLTSPADHPLRANNRNNRNGGLIRNQPPLPPQPTSVFAPIVQPTEIARHLPSSHLPASALMTRQDHLTTMAYPATNLSSKCPGVSFQQRNGAGNFTRRNFRKINNKCQNQINNAGFLHQQNTDENLFHSHRYHHNTDPSSFQQLTKSYHQHHHHDHHHHQDSKDVLYHHHASSSAIFKSSLSPASPLPSSSASTSASSSSVSPTAGVCEVFPLTQV